VPASTVSRYLARAGLVIPEPRKRPRSSCLRFEADLPNECWQSDFTPYPLASGAGTEVLVWLGDHSRFALRITAHHRVTGQIVVAQFRAAVTAYGSRPRHGSVSLKVFPAVRLVGLGGRETVGEGDGKRVQGRLFHRTVQRAWPVPVGSRDRVTR
jgi:transposase InsO family protein